MKVLVVDDESLARERLARLLAKLEPDAQCLLAEGGEQALELVRSAAPDLMLLDIRMPGIDGIEVAARVARMEQPPAVIFCTAYDDHALEALQHQVSAYLLKPVREAQLAQALANAGRVNRVQLAALAEGAGDAVGGARTQISSQSHRGIETMPLCEVRCFVAQDKYVTAYSDERTLLIPDSLKDLERELAGTFLRVHRNALVSLAHIESLQHESDGWVVALAGVSLRPQISRRHLKEVRQRLLSR